MMSPKKVLSSFSKQRLNKCRSYRISSVLLLTLSVIFFQSSLAPKNKQIDCVVSNGIDKTISNSGIYNHTIEGSGPTLYSKQYFTSQTNYVELITNSYLEPENHNLTIQIPQIPNYDAIKININLNDTIFNACEEFNSSSKLTQFPEANANFSIEEYSNGKPGALGDDFYFPNFFNLTTMEIYMNTSESIIGWIDVQLRNGTFSPSLDFPTLIWNSSINPNTTPDWYEFIVNPEDRQFPVCSPGYYLGVVNASNCIGGYANLFFNPSPYGTVYRYSHNSIYFEIPILSPLGIRLRYIPISPTNPDEVLQYSLEDTGIILYTDQDGDSSFGSETEIVLHADNPGEFYENFTFKTNQGIKVNFSLEITYNYSGTDVLFQSNFTCPSGSPVQWNLVSASCVEFPESGYSNLMINLTNLPKNLNPANSFISYNATPDNTLWTSYMGPYTYENDNLTILQAPGGNHTWLLNFTLPNIIENITTLDDSQNPQTIFEAGGSIRFNISASLSFLPGYELNLSVFEPIEVGDNLYYESIPIVFSQEQTSALFGPHTLNNPTLKYGEYRIQSDLHEEFVVGHKVATFIVRGPTNITVEAPGIELAGIEPHYFTVQFNDTFLGLPVKDAEVIYTWNDNESLSFDAIYNETYQGFRIKGHPFLWGFGEYSLEVEASYANVTSKTFYGNYLMTRSYQTRLENVTTLGPVVDNASLANLTVRYDRALIPGEVVLGALVELVYNNIYLCSLESNGTPGYYSGTFQTSLLPAGDVILALTASKGISYQQQMLTIPLYVIGIEIEDPYQNTDLGPAPFIFPGWGFLIMAIAGGSIAFYLVIQRNRFGS